MFNLASGVWDWLEKWDCFWHIQICTWVTPKIKRKKEKRRSRGKKKQPGAQKSKKKKTKTKNNQPTKQNTRENKPVNSISNIMFRDQNWLFYAKGIFLFNKQIKIMYSACHRRVSWDRKKQNNKKKEGKKKKKKTTLKPVWNSFPEILYQTRLQGQERIHSYYYSPVLLIYIYSWSGKDFGAYKTNHFLSIQLVSINQLIFFHFLQ